MAAHANVFRFGGPLVGDDGAAMGSLMLLELRDRAALERHMHADPFFSAGLFQSVSVWTSRQIVPEATAGELRGEIARQRTIAATLGQEPQFQ